MNSPHSAVSHKRIVSRGDRAGVCGDGDPCGARLYDWGSGSTTHECGDVSHSAALDVLADGAEFVTPSGVWVIGLAVAFELFEDKPPTAQ